MGINEFFKIAAQYGLPIAILVVAVWKLWNFAEARVKITEDAAKEMRAESYRMNQQSQDRWFEMSKEHLETQVKEREVLERMALEIRDFSRQK